ncbi:PepSY domain-containing protein [Pseudomonas aeruginosa]|uniref:PepSY domain-containing protein n=1 Tax=Pseudomonas aeruginosa TaxID=287 RepID=UPI0003BACAE5|nr:PepSY-associated TM helix domain-containing protein [Pseudomonas aeruginosa]ERX80195.1 hypothetical protein P997_01623 [Pseudomonas aeruginosa 62]MDI3755865.1 PepSY domain-containing protein [Pseudomonas aeruginosa]MDI3999471.1 PepSY domain-containing protein [Pseudomonas aeruginosa]HCF1748775.1 PepSY domain-containing protein [Pseudomonas aeruginosa]
MDSRTVTDHPVEGIEFFALHMASFGGTTVLWLYFLLGMAGAWLFYSGNLLWIETRRRKANKHQGGTPRQRLDTRLMAAATVGICLGCVCGISLTIVGGKWLNGWADDLTRCHQALYYSAFFTALAWSFWRGARRGPTALERRPTDTVHTAHHPAGMAGSGHQFLGPHIASHSRRGCGSPCRSPGLRLDGPDHGASDSTRARR